MVLGHFPEEGLHENPLISVIMNCFNGETYLRVAIESVLAQTYSNWEIIFWDNLSTDRSPEIVKSYRDLRIRYFRAEKKTSLGEARNLAVEKAGGVWLAFLDVDDVWLPEKLELQVQELKKDISPDSLGMIYGRTHRLQRDEDQGELVVNFRGKPLPEGDIFKELLLKENFIPLVSLMVKKSAYIESGGIPVNYTYAEDYYLIVSVAAQYRTKAVQRCICFYRVHENSMTARIGHKLYLESIDVLNFWKGRLAPKEYARKLSDYQVRMALHVFYVERKWIEGLLRLLRTPFIPWFFSRLIWKLKSS